jgi:hypothetical protein
METIDFLIRSQCNVAQGYQGCQMVWFQTKNPNLAKFWRVLVYFVVIFLYFPHFGISAQEKSGNPEGYTASRYTFVIEEWQNV